MAKSIYTILLSTVLTFLVGCGGGSSSTNKPKTNNSTITLGDTYKLWTVAKNNLVQDSSKPLNEDTIKVLIEPNKQIGENDISNTVDSIYGKVNGIDTGVSINQNYTNGTKMIVRIYDPSGNILATSEILTYTGADKNVRFNDINF